MDNELEKALDALRESRELPQDKWGLNHRQVAERIVQAIENGAASHRLDKIAEVKEALEYVWGQGHSAGRLEREEAV